MKEKNMCYRFVRESNIAEIAREFDVDEIEEDISPSFNVSPTHNVPALINDGVRRIEVLRWGLIPPWAENISIGNKLLNARGETITEKPSFRLAFKKRRCLIPATGYYEWKREGSNKTPMFIHLKDEKIFGMAGLWERWTSPSGEQINSFTIITIAANDWLKPVNDRMPVIIPKDQVALWLDSTGRSEDDLMFMLKPYDADLMEKHKVSSVVNSPKNDSPENIIPVK